MGKDLVYEVAKAIYESKTFKPFDELPEKEKRAWEQSAVTVIEVIREFKEKRKNDNV